MAQSFQSQGRAVQESLLAEADLAEARNTAQEKHNVPAVIAQSAANPDARALAQSALAAMGGEAGIRAIERMRLEGIGHQHLLEQSERPEGPWLVDYRDFSEFRDPEKENLFAFS